MIENDEKPNLSLPFPKEDVALGVEEEDKESGEQILKPFDPTLIRVESKPMTLGQLISRMKHNEIDMAPEFQRTAGIWKEEAQSRLIESILIRIPIPAFYFDASNEDKWIVVDGLQRLTTLQRFVITKQLHLRGLEFLNSLSGNTFDELPRQFQRRIDEAQIVVFLIEKNTPPEVKFNIFKRINTGGVPLAAQEIRHALNQGAVTALLRELAHSPEFKRATNWRVREDRMDDRECVTRFLAFVLFPPENYRAVDFDSFLSDAMAEINRLSPEKLENLAKGFLRSMRAAYEIFGDGAFRKHASRSYPINKAIFEAWSVCLDGLNDEQLERLIKQRSEVVDAFVQLCSDYDFSASVSQSTGDPNRIKRRFSEVKKLITKVLNAKITDDQKL